MSILRWDSVTATGRGTWEEGEKNCGRACPEGQRVIEQTLE